MGIEEFERNKTIDEWKGKLSYIKSKQALKLFQSNQASWTNVSSMRQSSFLFLRCRLRYFFGFSSRFFYLFSRFLSRFFFSNLFNLFVFICNFSENQINTPDPSVSLIKPDILPASNVYASFSYLYSRN